MRKLVYLCGPITGLTFEGCDGWRKMAARSLGSLGIEVLSPMRGNGHLAQHGSMPYFDESNPLTTPRGIATKDRFDCLRADVVLANFLGAERISVGSVMELGWADAARKPVVAVMERGNVHEHPMVLESVSWRVETLDEALWIVGRLLTPGA